MKKWKILSSKELFAANGFKFRTDQCELSDGRVMPNYYVIEFYDWVNIIPITRQNEVVLINQYRHAAGETKIELPGGTLDEKNEDPKKAALRELEEETGYMTEDLRLVGKHRPNPALQNNWVYTFVALGCEKVGEPQLDAYEEIEVVTKSVPEMLEMIKTGEINHSIIIASIHKALSFIGYAL